MATVLQINEINSFTEKIKASGQKYGSVGINGDLHEGHLMFLEECKKRCDYLIVNFSEFFVHQILRTEGITVPILSDSELFQRLCNRLESNKNVDYIFHNLNFSYHEDWYKSEKFLGLNWKLRKICSELQLPERLTNLSSVYLAPAFLEMGKVTTRFVGIKNVVSYLLAIKVMDLKRPYEIIWKTLRTNSGDIISRSSSSFTLGHVLKWAIDQEKELTLKSLREKFPTVSTTIVDLNELKRLDKVNDNCAVLFEDKDVDIFCYKDGELVW